MKYERYSVQHYRKRSDGRVEPAGRETVVLSPSEALELSYSALVVTRSGCVIHEGRHMQPDVHLGWIS